MAHEGFNKGSKEKIIIIIQTSRVCQHLSDMWAAVMRAYLMFVFLDPTSLSCTYTILQKKNIKIKKIKILIKKLFHLSHKRHTHTQAHTKYGESVVGFWLTAVGALACLLDMMAAVADAETRDRVSQRTNFRDYIDVFRIVPCIDVHLMSSYAKQRR